MSTQLGGPAPDQQHALAGVVIPFPTRQSPDNRLDMQDRIALLAWADASRACGIGRVAVEAWETGEDPRVVGDFAMIYRQDYEWATWSLARANQRYSVWETAYGCTLGVFDAIGPALAFVAAQASALRLAHAASGQPRRSGRVGRGARAGAAAPGGQRATG